MLFVDLVKAFDRVIRELVFGIPPGVTNVSKQLRDLGLTETQLNFVTWFGIRVSFSWCAIYTHLRGSRTVAGISHHGESWRKTGMCLREYGVQHTVRTGPHGIER